MLEIRKVARRTKSCSNSEKLLKSCRATSGQPYLRSSPLKLSCRRFLKLADVFEKKADVENTASGDEEALLQVLMISTFLFLILIVYRNKTDN